MAIKIFVTDEEPESPEAPEKKRRAFQASVDLKGRKTLDGNLMILDHADIDIVMVPSESKIVTFPKNSFMDMSYNTQDRLFKFLQRKGVILPDSIRAGNVYGSLEAEHPKESKYADVFQIALHMIAKFIEEERPYMEAIEQYDEMDDERLLNPDDEESTELGEVPHEETKGTLAPSYPGYFYGLSGVYRY